ncbi:hypothetical protein HELRODRAFT_88781, partial [Helobdella robusta]|uniref:Uncharacterized protein n=1 Tax=Helobdella robusta TaxID=6412 RepID=T1G763_HELRO
EGFENVDDALSHMKEIFSSTKFAVNIPMIFFQHQLYSLISNRTIVDKEINKLRSDFKIRVLKLTSTSNEYNILFMDDYVAYVTRCYQDTENSELVERFIEKIVMGEAGTSVKKERFIQSGFNEKEILKLVSLSLLAIRDVGDWWITFPKAGLFLKTLSKGRKYILSMVRKTRHKEILLNELEKRPFLRSACLGFMYHLYDIIGADLVQWFVSSQFCFLFLLFSVFKNYQIKLPFDLSQIVGNVFRFTDIYICCNFHFSITTTTSLLLRIR